MDGARKSAILLLSLDQALAAEVLGKMPRELVERTTLAIASVENVTREEQEAVLNEFKAAFLSRPIMQPAGPETARELLARTLDQNDVEPIQQRIEEQVQAGPFAFLHNRHADDIRLLIEDEHPQTIAVVVAQLTPPLAAQILADFDAEKQADILGRLARLGPTDRDVLAEIARSLIGRIGRRPQRTGGLERAADILRETVPSMSYSVMQSLDHRDGSLADSLRESMFSFKNLIALDDSTFGTVLEHSDSCHWAVALKGCSEPLRRRVLAALSPALAQALKDEMNSLGPMRLSEITAVQSQIAQIVLKLESDGQIELPKSDSRHRNAQTG